MKKTKINILLFFLFATVLKVFPATETKNARLGNGLLLVGSQITVNDEKFLGPNWNNYNGMQHEALVRFGLDETKHKVYPNFTAYVGINIKGYSITGAQTLNQNKVVALVYNQSGIYFDKSVLNVGNYPKLVVSVVNVGCTNNTTNLAMTPPAELFLEVEVKATRYYNFPSATYVPSSHPSLLNYNVITKPCANGTCISELEVYWQYFQGAEEYELEWTWVNDYPGAPLQYDFRTDATRITTMNNHYRIPILYEKGYLLYRMRGIGKKGPAVTDRVEGYWTNTGTILDYGAISSYPANLKYQIAPGNQQTSDNMNWVSTMTFAEDGKKGAGISYMDGLLMSRQSQAKLNTENKTIVQQTLYDYQGRPAISVLPAPTNVYYFDYKNNFSLNASNQEYSKDDFDPDVAACSVITPPMSVLSAGAANYYSPNNPNQVGAQGYVPDAKQYPFVQVEYAPDKTGNIIAQSMPGEAHKIGANHETQFFYTNPGDKELLRLFGSEAGNVGHYDKNMVVDANGQISTTYKDMNGKVVATALMGSKPAALDAIVDYNNTEALIDDLTKFNKTDINNYTIVSSKNIFIENVNSIQTFKYEFTPQDFNDAACAPSKCFDCIYEVEFRVTDNCGANIIAPVTAIVGAIVNSGNVGSCDSPANTIFQLSPSPISVTFINKGTYKVTKTLKVSNIPIAQYVAEYLSSGNTCIKTLQQLITEQTNAIDFSSCGSDCASCSTSVSQYVAAHPGLLTAAQIINLQNDCGALCAAYDPCEASRQAMLSDFIPGGQYATYNGWPGLYNGCNDPASIFYTGASLSELGIKYNSITFPVNLYAHVLGTNGFTYVDPATLSPADFIKYFKQEWAELYLNNHPEKAYLDFCTLNKASDLYDYDMLQINSFDEACQKGFLKPLSGQTGTCLNPCTTVNYDPFFNTNGQGLNFNSLIKDAAFTDQYGNSIPNSSIRGVTYNYKDFMLYAFNNGYPISSNPVNNATNQTIYNLAKITAGNTSLAFGCDPCTKDKEWIQFRELYLNYKLRLVAQRKTDYVMLASSPTQTTGFNGCMLNSGLNSNASSFIPSSPNNIVVTNATAISPNSPPYPTSLNFLPFTFGQVGTSLLPFVPYTFMGYPVSKSPYAAINSCGTNNLFYDPWGISCAGNSNGDSKQPCSSVHAGSFSFKTARFPQFAFDISTLINNYNSSQTPPTSPVMPPVAAVGPPPTAAVTANYCDDLCTSYADDLLTKLRGCNLEIDPNPSNIDGYNYLNPDFTTNPSFNVNKYTSIRIDLIDVCKRGCDGDNPFGASTVKPSNNLSATGPLTFNNFGQIITYYANLYSWTLGPDCSADLLGMPKPYGSNVSGTINNPSQLDTCGCNKVLSAQYHFLNNTMPAGVTTAEQYFAYVYGNSLSNFSEIECKCTAAWGGANALNTWYTSTQTNPKTNWTSGAGSQQAALFLNGPTYVPPFLDCGKPCLPCTTVVNAILNYNTINPTYVNSDNYSILLTTHLNNLFDFNLGYEDYMDFYNSCNTNLVMCQNQIPTANKLKNILNQWIVFYNNSLPTGPYGNTFNSSSSPTGIPAIFNTGATSDLLSCTTVPGITVNSGVIALPATNLPYVATTGANFININALNAGGETCANCVLLLKFTSAFGSIGSSPLSPPLAQVNTISFINDISNVTPIPFGQVPGESFQYNFSCEYGVGYLSCLGAMPPCFPPTMLCDKPYPVTTIIDNCASNLINNAYNNALNLYNEQIKTVTDNFTRRYKDKCLAVPDEKFERNYNLNEYHYTLYYYDQAGNLVRTVPPKGVTTLAAAQYNNVPAHKYVTNYSYQSYNAPLVSQSPDETGTTDYVYDKVGRIVASANAKQKFAVGGPFSSYTIYDSFGRIIEVGEVNASLSTIQTAINANVSVKTIIATFSQVIKTKYDTELNGTVSGQFPNAAQLNLRNRVASVTYEDTDDFDDNTYKHATHYSYDGHGNVKNMIQENGALSNLANKYFTMEYDYDIISGNVNTVGFQKGRYDQFFHKYEYDDDNRLHIVMTSKDGFVWDKDAKYFYYDHGPLARKELGEQKVHAEDFAYTIQGWIKAVNSNMLDTKTDIGKDGDISNYSSTVTNIHNYFGRDAFGYSLNYYGQGTFKDYQAIKNANFNVTNDKNLVASVNNISIGSGPFDLQLDAPDLYNGNISSMVTSFIDKDPTNTIINNTAFPQLTAYRYDQLHRIKQMKAYRDFNFTNNANTWNALGSYDNSYESNFTYDKNGNILTHFRNGTTSAVVPGSLPLMDNMTYLYEANGSNINTNKLIGVNDNATGSLYTTDIKGTSSAVAGSPGTFDYTYDNIGNLIADKKEYISEIKWTVDRKVAAVIRNRSAMFAAGKNMPDIFFEYDANRQRVLKLEKPILNNGTTYPYLTEDNWKNTYYVRDAIGNIMATYGKDFTLVNGNNYNYNVVAKEFDIYGSSRLGSEEKYTSASIGNGNFNNSTNVYSNLNIPANINTNITQTAVHPLGKASYELSNHLGNVITVISDRKTGVDGPVPDNIIDYYLSDVRETHDYYPYGYDMPGRTFGSDYRVGHNGQEREKSTFEGAYSAEHWGYDARLGRRWQTDPIVKNWESSYACFLDNPIRVADPDGADGITGLLDAVMSFGIDVGMDFISSIILEGKTSSQAFDDIGWASASWGAVKTYALATVAPPGGAAAMKIKKVVSSKIGQIVISVAEKMVAKIGDNYLNGKYNDGDGNFDFDNVNFEDVFYEATIETLIEKGLGGQADKLLKALEKENSALAKKLQKLVNKSNAGESKSRTESYKKTLQKQEVKVDQARNNYIVSKAKEKISTGATSKIVVHKVKDNKETPKESAPSHGPDCPPAEF